METFNKTNTEITIEVITPEKAIYYLGRNIGNRGISKDRVTYYAEQMAKGEWKLNGCTIVLDENGYLLDGQHRLTACVVSKKPFETLVVRGVDHKAFATIDTGKPRNSSDVFKILGIPEPTNTSALVMGYENMKKGANPLIKRARYTTRLSMDDLAAAYKERPEQFDKVRNYAQKLYRANRHLFTAKEYGSIIMYLWLERKHPFSKIESFFNALAIYGDRETFAQNDVIDVLRKRLQNKEYRTGDDKAKALCIAWNNYIQGQNRKQICVKNVETIEYL